VGTLQVFTFVNAGVIVLRTTPPFVPTMMEAEVDQSKPTKECDVDIRHLKRHIQDEHSKLISPTSSDNHRDYSDCKPTDTYNNSLAHIHTHTHRSSLLPDDGGAVLLRQVTQEFHSSSSLIIESDNDDRDGLGSHLERNGSKPYWFTLSFTLSAVLSSMGVSRKWPAWVVIPNMAIVLLSAVSLSRLPQSAPPSTFSCPAVPVVPLLGILCNSYMMGSMPSSTWSVIGAWLFAGVCFYFSYGMHHSELRKSAM